MDQITGLKKVRCPFCGYEMPVYVAHNASCTGIYIICKGRNCKKLFEICVR